MTYNIMKMTSPAPSAPSNRILYDVPCAVCRDHSSGKHYGVYACDGCAGFFKRSVRRDRRYACKARNPGLCIMDKTHRNQCRACRFTKCLNAGMNKDAVQHERGPRNSTIRRQMALFMKDTNSSPNDITLSGTSSSAVDLVLPKHTLMPPSNPMSIYNHPYSTLLSTGLPLCPPIPISPPLIPSLLLSPPEPAAICEAAARILFMNVKWTKNVPSFNCLSVSDRILLLEESWSDLFIISSVQFLYPIDLKILLGTNKSVNLRDIERLEMVLDELAKLRPDVNEYAFLRAIVLFRTNFEDNDRSNTICGGVESTRKLQDIPTIAAHQENSRLVLMEYSRRMCLRDPLRSSRMLQLLPLIREVPTTIIEALFFRATIGDIRIEKLISDMYRSGNYHNGCTA